MNFITTIIGSFLLTIATILPILNPLAVTPVFLSLTSGASTQTRTMLSKRMGAITFIMLSIASLAGSIFLKFFGISLPIVQVAGGLLVVSTAWQLLNAENPDTNHHQQMAEEFSIENAKNSSFYPLTFPITCGPGSLAAAITVGATLPTEVLSKQIVSIIGILLGCLVIGALVYFCSRYAAVLLYKMGSTGTAVLSRLTAFILLCVGVQISWNGIQTLIISLPHFK